MMKETLYQLNQQLNTLSVFRKVLETPVVSSLQKLLRALESDSLETQLSAYGTFSHVLFEHGGNLTAYLCDAVLDCESPYLSAKMKDMDISPSLEAAFLAELKFLNQVARLRSSDLKSVIEFDGYLADWETDNDSLVETYENMISNLSTNGHGLFAKYRAFRVKGGQLIPVAHPDSQTINQLYGYSRERNQVLENTRALMEGKPASNVLLYGDAGTGKSSTIKACVNAFADKGLRLVEFDRSQLREIPAIIEQLCDNPLKFIFYIDDLSFEDNGDDFSSLKGILEGGVTGSAKNIAIYATSNRRHLVKESMEARMGSDLHLNDTLQETMSLSARFGLTITFSKPEKELYLEIVKSLATEYGVQVEEAELFRKAEAFAIRANGRSPRTAKQFIQQASIGLK